MPIDATATDDWYDRVNAPGNHTPSVSANVNFNVRDR